MISVILESLIEGIVRLSVKTVEILMWIGMSNAVEVFEQQKQRNDFIAFCASLGLGIFIGYFSVFLFSTCFIESSLLAWMNLLFTPALIGTVAMIIVNKLSHTMFTYINFILIYTFVFFLVMTRLLLCV